MGGSYGSIHFQTTDRERVLAALDELASSTKTRFLLGPEYGGWIAAYPEQNGQDESVSQSLAKALSLPTLHLIVHDDDIFAYFYYREGRLVDEYDSCPDYFGEVDAATREQKRGRPELLRDLLRPPRKIADLQEILTPSSGTHPVFVSESAERFAKVIGLTNAVTSYEYLTDGEREGIKGWRHFTHVPALSGARADKRAEAARIRREKAQLLKEGRLLLDLKSPPGGMFPAQPVFAAKASGGFFLAWEGLNGPDTPLLQTCSEGLKETGLSLPSNIHAMATAGSGAHLALGCASGRWEAQLWHLNERRLVKTIPHARAVQLVAFSDDSRMLLTGCSDGQLTVTSIESGEEIFTCHPSTGLTAGAVHPSGKFAVVNGARDLFIIDLAAQSVRRILVHGPHDPFVLQEPGLAEMLKTTEYLMRAGFPGYDQRVRELYEDRQRAIEQATGKPTPVAERSTEQVSRMAFDRTGNLLACANTGGLRVYDWDELLSSPRQTPPPRFAVEAEEMPADEFTTISTAYSYNVCFDQPANRMLFCGMEGKVKSLDLTSGEARTLLVPPDRGPIVRMSLSADQSALAIGYKPVFFERAPKTKWLWQVWDYHSLTGS